MRQRQERQKLATVSARIDSYEAVEGSSEEVEKVKGHRGQKAAVVHRRVEVQPSLSLSRPPCSDPEGVQPLRPDGSHAGNVAGGDPTAAPGGAAEDEGGQRQPGTSNWWIDPLTSPLASSELLCIQS